MFDDMLNQLQQMQERLGELKKRLDSIMVKGEVENGAVVVKMNGNGRLLNLDISDELLQAQDKEQLEELVTVAINRAMERAQDVADTERAALSREMLPGFPGMV